MFIFWIILIVGLYFVLKDRNVLSGVNHQSSHVSKAQELLDQRLISGEVDEETYARLKKLLND